MECRTRAKDLGVLARTLTFNCQFVVGLTTTRVFKVSVLETVNRAVLNEITLSLIDSTILRPERLAVE